jgi:hypothetical protein
MIWLITGILLCAWAVLRVLGDERQRLLDRRSLLERAQAADAAAGNAPEPSN